MSFRLATDVRRNPFNFVIAHCYERVSDARMHIDKVNWITVRNYGKPKWHSFSPSSSWKGKFWASTLSGKMCPRKQTTELKLLSLVSFFFRRRYLIFWYQLLHPCIMGSMPFRFYWATLYIHAPNLHHSSPNMPSWLLAQKKLGCYWYWFLDKICAAIITHWPFTRM